MCGCRLERVLTFYAFCKAVLVVAVGAAALLVWNWMGSGEQETPSHRKILMQQLKAQAPLLLQMCHLAKLSSTGVPRPAVGRASSYRISAKRRTRKLQARALGGSIRGAASAVSEELARCFELGMPIRPWAQQVHPCWSLGWCHRSLRLGFGSAPVSAAGAVVLLTRGDEAWARHRCCPPGHGLLTDV